MKYNSRFQICRKSVFCLTLFIFTILSFAAHASAQNSEAKQKSPSEAVQRLRSVVAARDFQSAVLDPCDPIPISFGQTISNSLTDADCSDPESAQVADLYIFSGTQGQAISSAMSSSQFDTLLALFDINGEIVTFNDDIDASTTNSRIPPNGTFTLPFTGQYFLFATSYDETGRGNYTINLTGGGTACVYTLSSAGQNFAQNGGTGSFTVTTSAPGCAWQAVSNASWITTSSAGSGSGTVAFTVAANASTQSRTATISVGGKIFTITQSGLTCSYTISPAQPQIPAIGGLFSLTVTASDASCSTNVTTTNPFITIQTPTGTGTRVVHYTVAPNNVPVARNATFTVGGTTQFAVSQSFRATAYSFDTGAQANIGVFRPNGGLWLYKNNNVNTGEPGDGFNSVAFGLSTDQIAPADYDGDGRTDIAVFRKGDWFIIESRNGNFRAVRFGQAGDKPLPADFDGDGKADINVFRPSNGTWYRLNSSNGQFVAVNFGLAEDIPVIADFYADGRSDIAVYRPSTGTWFWLNSPTNQFNAFTFGLPTDIPVPMDYDGDSATDIAIYRPSNGTWYRLNSSNGQFVAVNFGTTGDIPVPAEYDGDGKADIAVYRPSSGTWYRLKSATGAFDAWQFGSPNDIPLPAAYQP